MLKSHMSVIQNLLQSQIVHYSFIHSNPSFEKLGLGVDKFVWIGEIDQWFIHSSRGQRTWTLMRSTHGLRRAGDPTGDPHADLGMMSSLWALQWPRLKTLQGGWNILKNSFLRLFFLNPPYHPAFTKLLSGFGLLRESSVSKERYTM
jgi:hypothetical protein